MLRETKFSRFQAKPFFILLICMIIQSGYVHSQSSHIQNSSTQAPFRSRLMNVEAARNETFRYHATLENLSKTTKIYMLQAELPPGWLANFMVEGTPVRSLEMTAGKSYDINIEVNPSLLAPPGKTSFLILAISEMDTLKLPLEAVVKGSFNLDLSTPTGKLNEELVAGRKKELLFELKNSGSLPLTEIELSGLPPKSWTVTFEDAQVKELAPGKSITVKALIEVPEKSIAGDYVLKVSAKNANVSAESAIRVQVRTSVWTGLWGIAIILISIASIFFLIRKFGRR